MLKTNPIGFATITGSGIEPDGNSKRVATSIIRETVAYHRTLPSRRLGSQCLGVLIVGQLIVASRTLFTSVKVSRLLAPFGLNHLGLLELTIEQRSRFDPVDLVLGPELQHVHTDLQNGLSNMGGIGDQAGPHRGRTLRYKPLGDADPTSLLSDDRNLPCSCLVSRRGHPSHDIA